jgi:hypothetical protein
MKKLGSIFPHKVFKRPKAKEKITREMIDMLSKWLNYSFHVFCGNYISSNDDTAIESLSRYIIRASFSQERMQHLDQDQYVQRW